MFFKSITMLVVLSLANAHYLARDWDIPQRCIDAGDQGLSCEVVPSDALLPHPWDCELFFYCVEGQPICRQCPAGLHFNPAEHVCDIPEHAGCDTITAEASLD